MIRTRLAALVDEVGHRGADLVGAVLVRELSGTAAVHPTIGGCSQDAASPPVCTVVRPPNMSTGRSRRSLCWNGPEPCSGTPKLSRRPALTTPGNFQSAPWTVSATR